MVNYIDYVTLESRDARQITNTRLQYITRREIFPSGKRVCKYSVPQPTTPTYKATEVFDGCRKYDRLAPLSSVIDPTEDSS